MGQAGSTVALVVAAGRGERAGGGIPKQYRLLAGKPMVCHSIDALAAHPGIDAIYVAIGAGQQAAFDNAVGGRTARSVIGGAARQDSVRAGLERIAEDGGAARVLIHDAARPRLPAAVIDRLLGALDREAGAVPVLPVVDSIALGGSELGDPVDRDALLRVQTPQAFRFDRILLAHRDFTGAATDDAQVARAIGIRVAAVEGDERLEKLTHDEDFARTEAAMSGGLISRTGMGFDVHSFGPGERLWLCGIQIAHSQGVVGHSDADVGLHALTDAILGAIGEGDIGQHFPPSDARWRGAPSSIFLEHARDLVAARGGVIDHVDVTVICEAPKVGPHRAAMRACVAGLLRLPEGRVSIKATTTERLGFTGRGEGLAAQAVATVRLAGDH